MTAATFLVGIVLAIALGVAIAWLILRSRTATPAPATAAEQPLAEAMERIEAQLRFQEAQLRSQEAQLRSQETQIRENEMQRQHTLGGLGHQLSALSRETVALSQALRAPNSRGRWGELTLRRVAELAGMAPYCDFFEQESGSGMRPDMIVRLPGNRTLAVDAKVPLAAYLDAESAQDDSTRRAALEKHAQQVTRHVNHLSAREYWSQFQPAPEMVVLFLAGEHFLTAALERDPELLERALERRVVLATPMTLVSVLKGVSYGWKQERLAQNAVELRRIAGEFYDRVRAFAESYADAGRHLAKAVEMYNRSAGSWEARLLPSLKRMRELGAGSGNDAAEPGRIDTAVREPQRINGGSGIPT